eukprot:11192405-Lingulodinium_polyedra.AAC.1
MTTHKQLRTTVCRLRKLHTTRLKSQEASQPTLHHPGKLSKMRCKTQRSCKQEVAKQKEVANNKL